MMGNVKVAVINKLFMMHLLNFETCSVRRFQHKLSTNTLIFQQFPQFEALNVAV